MKREDLSRLFSTKKLNGVPTYKILVSAVVVLALVATMGVTLAAGALPRPPRPPLHPPRPRPPRRSRPRNPPPSPSR